MKPDRKARLTAYIEKWQRALRLQDWVITLAEEEPSSTAWADVYIRSVSMRAAIAVDGRTSPEHEEGEVLHELLEVFLDEMDSLVQETIKHMPEAVRGAYVQRASDTRHRVIHRLETAFLPKRNQRPWDIIKQRPD